jgi:hypothetical protein
VWIKDVPLELDVSVGTASGPTEKLLPQVLGFWWIEKLGRIMGLA